MPEAEYASPRDEMAVRTRPQQENIPRHAAKEREEYQPAETFCSEGIEDCKREEQKRLCRHAEPIQMEIAGVQMNDAEQGEKYEEKSHRAVLSK
jgi:hypothetical protein